MRQKIGQVVFILASLFPTIGWGQETVPLCDQHPMVDRSLTDQAKRELRGLRSIYQDALEKRQTEGLEVHLTLDAGGGDCPGPETARGRAAAAVGALLYNGQIHCSGVLIAPSTVLTAAHCVFDFDLAKMEFVIGEDSETPIQRASILRAHHHQDYDASKLGINDLAFLHLDHLITEVEPVEFQRTPLKSQSRRVLLHVGYGIAGAVPGRRRCVNIPVHATCDRTFSSQTAGLNTCRGDSGGGVFYDDGASTLLAGITNWGDDLCRDFGVSLDVGAFVYTDWITSRIHEAKGDLLSPADVEPAARIYANPKSLKAVQAQLMTAAVPLRQEYFEAQFKDRWVAWEARRTGIPRATHLGRCDVFVEHQGVSARLRDLKGGCDLGEGSEVAFEGRLAAYQGDYFEVVQPVMTRRVDSGPRIGDYRLLALANPQVVTQRRTQDFRLESRHGEGSGRLENCQQIRIEGSWTIDRSQPIGVAIAYQNHGGVEEPKILTDQELCIPLWAEGFGGFRLGNVQIDAGNKGVISGSISFTVIREEAAPAPAEVWTGTLSAGIPVEIPLAEPGKEYELRLALKDGREIVTRQSLQQPGVEIRWDRTAGTIRILATDA